MRKFFLVFCFISFFIGGFSQGFSEKKIRLPEKLSSLDFLSKERLVLSPDGSLLCIMREQAPYTAYLLNIASGQIEDSIAVDSYSPEIKWSGDSKILVFYSYAYPISYFSIYNRNGKLLKKIESPYEVLNYQVDSTASAIVAATYYLPESGATYTTDITGAYIYPKGLKYNYKLLLFDIAGGLVKDSIKIKATYPRVEGKWKKDWLVFLNQSDAEFESYSELSTIDFKEKKITAVAQSKELFVNESFMKLQVLNSDKLFVATGTTLFELDEASNIFNRAIKVNEFESFSLNSDRNSSLSLVAGVKGKRWAENEIILFNKKGEVTSIDIYDQLPHLTGIAGDSVLLFTFTKEDLTIRNYKIVSDLLTHRPEVLVQNNIEPENRFVIPGTEFIASYNSKAWQITDLSSQLIVHQKKDYENYGTKLIPVGEHPFIIKYTSTQADLVSIGKWNEIAGTLVLQDARLKEGNSVYSSPAMLSELAYNPGTSLLSGLFTSSNYYYVAMWDLTASFAPKYILKIERDKISTEEKSIYSKGSSPILISHIIFTMQEQEWKKTNAADMINRIKQLAGKLSSFTMKQLAEANDYSWRHNIAAGKLTGTFVYQDTIYGHLLIDLVSPSRSVYYCHKPLKGGFAGYQFVRYIEGGFGTKQIELSDKGNIVTISNLGQLSLHEINTGKHSVIVKSNKEQWFDGSSHFLLENKGIVMGTAAWYDVTDLRPVHTITRTLFSDSAIYIPEKKQFVIHLAGNRGYVELRLDNLTIHQVNTTHAPLEKDFKRDTVFRLFYPDKKQWVIAGKNGIGYDSSKKTTPDYMGRSFPTSLKGEIEFIHLYPEINKILIGNTSESSFEYWDVLTEQLVFKLVIIDEKNFIIQGAKGFYYATPGALSQIGFLQNGEAIPASFLDAGLNRPDILLESMFDTTDQYIHQLIAIYRKAALRKNSKSLSINPGISPVVKARQPLTSIQKESKYEVQISAAGKAFPVAYLSVQVNNITIWDTLFKKPLAAVTLTAPIQLTSGENQLVFIAKDADGNSSIPVFQRLVYQPVIPVKPTTLIIAMAVNNYKDDSRNLKYAIKDGKDILQAFRSIENETIVADSLFNESFTSENIMKLKEKLLQTGIEDKVIISFSGHGMLDDSLKFYLATYDMDFSAPEKNGFGFGELEDLLANIPARKKLLLIDACNSGNIEKDEMLTSIEENILAPEVSRQPDSTRSPKGVELPLPENANLQQVISQLFSSSSSRTGTEVIAATAGNAYAYESPEWKNGVFTFALLQAFRVNSDLDKNFNQQISIKELKRYVYPKVLELTKGMQQPLSRYENPNYDWDLLPMRYD